MDHPVGVRVAQRVQHLAGDADRLLERNLGLPSKPLAQGFPVDVGHRIPQEPAGLPRIEERKNVGVAEVSGRLDFVPETLRAEAGGEFGVQDLERDRAVMLEVPREVHSCHAAPAELALDRVAITEGLFEKTGESGHGAARWRRLESAPAWRFTP